MEPVLALSPSSPYQDPITNTRTSTDTPKLSRRDRLASFSRLLASEAYADIGNCGPPGSRKRRSLKTRRIDLNELPVIKVSPTSPSGPERIRNDARWMPAVQGLYSISDQLPFSPRLLHNTSPCYKSPSYQAPTPTKSPLYVSNGSNAYLGRGSFGNVSLCRHKDQNFALKIIHKLDSVGEKNFLGIRHPHLVSILHISHVSDKVLVFMEFAGHCNLQQVLDTKSELNFSRRLSFCIQIAAGLRHCHQLRLVHGDVKPANVIVSPHGVCKLGDFGHSIRMDGAAAAKDRPEGFGTVPYAAPEVLKGVLPTPASDMYAFGMLLWQVHTREVPFAGMHPHVIIYKVAHYGARPVFQTSGDRLLEQYSRVAQSCWSCDPLDRLEAVDVLKELKLAYKSIKVEQCK